MWALFACVFFCWNMKSEKHTQEKRKNPTVKWGIMVRSVYRSGSAALQSLARTSTTCSSTYSTCLGLNCNSVSLSPAVDIFYSFHLPSKSSKLTLLGLYCTVHCRILDQVQKLRCRRCSRSCCCWGFRQQHFLFRCQKSRGKLITLPPTLIQ